MKLIKCNPSALRDDRVGHKKRMLRHLEDHLIDKWLREAQDEVTAWATPEYLSGNHAGFKFEEE